MAKGKKKQIKKDSRKIEEVKGNETDLVDKILIAAGVLLFIFAFYILTLYITNKNTTKKETKKKDSDVVNVSDEYIILGRSLSIKKNSYLVVFYDKGNEDMDSSVSTYKNKNELSIYKVDMSSAFNKKYKTDGESNKNPSNASDFKINGITLIKVENKKIVEYIEGEEAVKNYLN